MNREIKFRIFSHADKCWHFWDIYQEYPQGIYGGVTEPMQYTGFKDKNDREIYEGDIVKCWLNIDGTLHEQNETPEIVFWEAKFCTKLCGFFCALNKNMTETMIEVIGNIHENPELISKTS